MVGFKIFAALFVVCVAQTSAATLSRDKPIHDDTDMVAETYGVQRRNPFACVSHLPEAYNIIMGIRDMWAEYKLIKENETMMRSLCERMANPDEKEKCNLDIDEDVSTKNTALLEKVKNYAPKLGEFLWTLKKCLFN